jgi:hypothetical protein
MRDTMTACRYKAKESLVRTMAGWMLLCALATEACGGEGFDAVFFHRAVFVSPPRRIPSRTAVDAPLLGNGDMGVALSGLPEALRFWLAKNDFWRLQSHYNTSGPRVFGGVDVSIPALKGASYRVEQILGAAVTRCTFVKGKTTVKTTVWVAATANVLFLDFWLEGPPVEVSVKLWGAEGDGSETEHDSEGGTSWVVRRFVKDVDIPTEAAATMSLRDVEKRDFTLQPGKLVTVVVAMASKFRHPEPLATARKLAASDRVDLAVQNRMWWTDFWHKSFVDIPDKDIERHYYLSNYVMASCSRDPEFPPPIFGTWITTDNPGWNGDYHLNYNHMAPYYGLYSSNHIEQADPYHAPILDFMERGKWYAKNVTGTRGVLYPVGIGPKGIETTVNCNRHGRNVEKGGLFFGQKSNAAYCVVNLSMRWYLTYDLDYAKTVYPFVREVADFWEDYLKFEKGRYVIYKDAVHEGSGENFNSIVSIGLARNVFETAIDMSKELGIDADRHEKWRHILAHISGYATQEKGGKTVFRYTEKGTDWWRNNTLGIQHIYPAGAIGLDSDPKLLEISRNTIDVMARWKDNNGMNSFFPAAVRVGYDPHVILAKLRTYVTQHAQTNGFAASNPHGIENCSIVPNTINEMLCMGHQGVLRVFPVWPKDKDARFGTLRAHGAFLVSSDLSDGVVQYVKLQSERGRACTFQNPWDGKAVRLYRNGKQAEALEGERFTFKTAVAEQVVLVPDGVSYEDAQRRMLPPVDAPVIQSEGDEGNTVALSSSVEDAQIRYTTDGSVPTEASALYTKPLVLRRTTTVKARAFKAGVRPSATVTRRVVIWGVDENLTNTFDTKADMDRVRFVDVYPGEPPRWIDTPRKGALNPNPGRRGIVGVHPKSRTEPCKLLWRVTVPKGKSRLRIVTSGDPFGNPGKSDYVLTVGVGGSWFKPEVIDAGHPPDAKNWRTLEYDLSAHAGKTVTITLKAAAGGPKHPWHNDRAYFDEIRIVTE